MTTVAIRANVNKPESVKRQAIRLMKVNGYYESYNPHGVGVWLVQNEYITCLAIGSHEQEVLDNIVNSGLWDSLQMSEEDHKEYSDNGWDDSYILLGNDCKPFWCEHLTMVEVEI